MASLATQEEKDLYYKQTKIRTGFTKFVKPEYFRHPEGEDLFGKLRFATKWATLGGGMFGLLRALVMAEKPTYRNWAFLCLKPVVPAVGIAAAFTITVYMATNIRKKDDWLNYGLGGATAGALLGAALKSTSRGVAYATCFGGLAMYFKSLESPFEMSVHRINFSPYEAKLLDFSFTPPKKGNWTKEKPTE